MIEHRYIGDDRHVVVQDAKTKKKMTFHVSIEEYEKGLAAYKAGAFIQDAFPFLMAHEREFLVSGLTEEEFNKLFPDE
jgi:hypothetical protein